MAREVQKKGRERSYFGGFEHGANAKPDRGADQGREKNDTAKLQAQVVESTKTIRSARAATKTERRGEKEDTGATREWGTSSLSQEAFRPPRTPQRGTQANGRRNASFPIWSELRKKRRITKRKSLLGCRQAKISKK